MPAKKVGTKKGQKKRPKLTEDFEADEHEEEELEEVPQKKGTKTRAKVGKKKRPSDVEEDEGEYPPYYYPPPPPPPKPSSKPTIAGALLILTAVLGIIFASIMGFGGYLIGNIEENEEALGLSGTSQIKGRVLIKNINEPAKNVTITIEGTSINTTTDSDGYYVLYKVPAGNQKIIVEKSGYRTIKYSTFIAPVDNWQWEWSRQYDRENIKEEHNFELETGTGTIESGAYLPFKMFSSLLYLCGLIAIIFSILALVGGYFALKRKNLAMAIIGGFLGILSFGFLIGSILAIVALILIILARREFRKSHSYITKEDRELDRF